MSLLRSKFGVILLALIALLIFIFIICFLYWRVWKGKLEAYMATAIPTEEAQQIINSMQGEWVITKTPVSRDSCLCGRDSYERMVVNGSIMTSMNIGRGASSPIDLRPARSNDGSLILDTYGSKAIVFKPEEGRIQMERMGWNLEWKKVEGDSNVTQMQVQGGTAGQVASSGQGSMAEEIQRLHQLKQQGILTEEEFSIAKFKTLGPGEPSKGSLAQSELPPPYPGDQEANVLLNK